MVVALYCDYDQHCCYVCGVIAVIENDGAISHDKQQFIDVCHHNINEHNQLSLFMFQGISNAYEITVLKFNNPVISDVKPHTSPTVTAYEIPNSERVYADPGNREETIYNWLKMNDICRINSNSIRYV